MLSGDRVWLRPFEAGDLAWFERWRNDPEVTEFLAVESMSARDLEAWRIETLERGDNRFFAIERLEAREAGPIGAIGLRNLDWGSRSAMLDVTIGEKALWGRGFGTDAVRVLLRFGFEQLELKRVYLYVLPFNRRGIRCYEKCGFRRIGYVPDFYLRRGSLWHLIEMEVVRRQFELASRLYR